MTALAPAWRTAIARDKASRPAREIVERGLIGPKDSVLNFGSGRAWMDTALFATCGRTAASYDPRFAPRDDLLLQRWDVVYCGYVLNALPPLGRAEVVDTIRRLGGRAYFAVRGHGDRIEGEPFEDGVVTSKGTFQRAFSPAELHCELIRAFPRVRRVTGTSRSPFVILEASIR